MEKEKKFDKYFICGYYDETNTYVGVFKKDTPDIVLVEAKKIFGEIQFE